MYNARRIDITLLDEELRGLVNASAKIFPITQEMVDNNLNPNNYEYGRVGKAIYIWYNGRWEYIVADDTDITWDEVKNKPGSFLPTEHKHTESDISDLDKYTKNETDSLLEDKSDVGHTHPYSPLDHNHDDKYADKSIEVEVEDHEERLYNIENGYTEGHSHNNLDALNKVTVEKIDNWDTVVSKADRVYVDSELSKKANSSTVSGHIDNTTVHVTQNDKNKWDNKVDVEYLDGFEPNQNLGTYTKHINDLPSTYPMGVSYTFVQSSQGWFSYGTVVTVKGYVSGGSTYQIYVPYSPSMGGKTVKMRFGDYSISAGNGWTPWKSVAIEPTISTTKPTDGSMWYQLI